MKALSRQEQTLGDRMHQYFLLTKPRVNALIIFCAVIGMFLALPGALPPAKLAAAIIGIALIAGAAAAMNCLIEQKIDAVMARTQGRPLPQGQVNSRQTLFFSGVIGGLGLYLLYVFVNPLTMWLTLCTFVGYAIIYTIFLKPATPQNIVIGGASGAMPPLLGWAAMTGQVTSESLLLFLIIFVWTPPHFWSLALYRTREYAKVGMPMLPVTHGPEYTRLQILLYTILLFIVSLLPWAINMSGLIYLVSAVILSGVFLAYAIGLYRAYSDRLAHKTFRYSIWYLSALFAALLVDHYFRF